LRVSLSESEISVFWQQGPKTRKKYWLNCLPAISSNFLGQSSTLPDVETA
jgi:hypothetical protein